MIKKLFGIIVLALWTNVGVAETTEEKRSHYIYNNLSLEYTECQHYYLIASEAVKTNNPDSAVIKNFLQSSKLSSELAFMYGEEAGMTVEAMLARTKMIETPEVRNQYWINKASEKYK